MHLELGFHVNWNEKLPQPQMHAPISILSQCFWFNFHRL
jgi:hypothetical protein